MTETAAQSSKKEGNNLILTNSLMTKQELDKFKEIVRKDYGVSLSDEQAFEQATALLNLFDYVIESRLDSRRNRVNMNNNQK
jgi:flagellin-specific chaperone FliS